MDKKEWDPGSFFLNEEVMARRIETCVSLRGWQHAVGLVNKRGIPVDTLRVAEVGCGTGTFSLSLALMGASVTLIDFNENVLNNAQAIYEMFGCRAEIVHADCLSVPPEELNGSFDLVISGGLAEHFKGQDRETCIEFHSMLLKDGGIAYISVPNLLSPFYWWIRSFRKLTGTWKISIEIPFSEKELKRLAGKAGFGDIHVLGSTSFGRDFINHLLGFRSACAEILPESLTGYIKERISKRKDTAARRPPCHKDEIVRHISKMMTVNQEDGDREIMNKADRFSSGLILFGSK